MVQKNPSDLVKVQSRSRSYIVVRMQPSWPKKTRNISKVRESGRSMQVSSKWFHDNRCREGQNEGVKILSPFRDQMPIK
ncbi:MAG: hypothetical protein JWR01_2921 [Subtercola sp.]|nr:hypothetical protein [Subtercola sp.]